MSRRFIEEITSDLSGEEGAHSVRVSGFELDLTDAEEETLNALLAPYRAKGVKLPGVGSEGQPTQKVRPGHSTIRELKSERQKMREWLAAHGYEPSARGRTSREQVEAYRLKTPAPGWTDPSAQNVTPAVTVGEALSSGAETRGAAAEAPQKAPRARQATTPKVTTKTTGKAPQGAAPAKKVAAARSTAAKAATPRRAAAVATVTDITTPTRRTRKAAVPPVTRKTAAK